MSARSSPWSERVLCTFLWSSEVNLILMTIRSWQMTQEISISIHENEAGAGNEQRTGVPNRNPLRDIFLLLFVLSFFFSPSRKSQKLFFSFSLFARLRSYSSLISHALENEDRNGKCVSTRISSHLPRAGVAEISFLVGSKKAKNLFEWKKIENLQHESK